MQSTKLQTEESEGGESRSTATAQLFDGRRSERGRQVQANWSCKTATDERCEKRRECDSVLRATNDEKDEELNGETNDEDMEDGETGFDDGSAQVRNIRDPGQPTVKEYQEHMTTHRPYRSWCKFSVMGRGVRRTGDRTLMTIWNESSTCQGSVERGTLKNRCLLCWSSVKGGTR